MNNENLFPALMLLVCLYRPQAPSHKQVSTETAENRAPPSDQGSVSTINSGCEGRKTVSNSSADSTSECLDTAGSDLDKVSFTPGHARSFSEPPYSNRSQSSSQLSRISGYSTGHSFSSSLEGRSSRRYHKSGIAYRVAYRISSFFISFFFFMFWRESHLHISFVALSWFIFLLPLFDMC